MKNILFYCSGGGYGHLARASAVLPFLTLDCRVTIACKEKKWPFQKMKNFRYVRLTDVNARARFYDKTIKTQVWNGTDASLDPFQRQMMEFFGLALKLKPKVIVVDSTPEIALIAKLFGYKVIYIYESLRTAEMRFDLAWLNSDGIVLPYPEVFIKKMHFPYPERVEICGGYTRLENYPIKYGTSERDILITFGKGESGEKTMQKLIDGLVPTGRKISVLRGGFSEKFLNKFPVEIIECKPDKVSQIINSAKILICGAGYNTVMEAFLLRKKTIVIPLERPYDEQMVKAEIFEEIGALKMLPLKEIRKISEVISVLEETSSEEVQKKIVDGSGSRRASEYILKIMNNEG